MSKVFPFLLIGVLALLVGFKFSNEATVKVLPIPKKWPKPNYDFKRNPMSVEGFELGRSLFYDPILSRDSSISCASCHLQYTAFTHVDHRVSHGIEGRIGTRNAPALANLAWQTHFHWDGGVNQIEVQALNPIQHVAEMDNSLEEVLKRLNNSGNYRNKFEKAFGSATVTIPNLMKALTMFELALVSSNSKYDQVSRKEKGVEFTAQEKNGYAIFKKNCASCHVEPLFNTGKFASNGLPIDPLTNDLGRYSITKSGKDSLQFKVPSLRNSEVSFPYMHDGRFKKLKDVINYYSDEIVAGTPYLSAEIKGPFHFSEHEKKDLLSFLLTLTDKEFLYNKEFSFPKNE